MTQTPGCLRFLRTDFVWAWLALVLLGLAYRPLTPIDETRAVTVAWEMWLHHDWLVPHLNGQPYSHKPPLLQWGMSAMWFLFGVHEWSARLVAPLFALANLFLTASLARRLWPEHRVIPRLAPWLLLGMPLWAVWSSVTLYDMLSTYFTLLGLHGVLRAAAGETRAGWLWTGVAIGGGVLAKGPVILLLILPVALTAPWWCASRPVLGWGGWYRGLLGAVLLGALIALAWAVPAGYAGGEEYRRMIFWGQSAGRITNAFAHKRAFWWYLAWLPALLFPWTLWPPLWHSLRRFSSADYGQRFCAVHVVSLLLIFSAISGKQVHYLLPLFPALALLAARLLMREKMEVSRDDQGIIGFLLLLAGLVFSLIPVFESTFGLPELANEAARIAERAPLTAKLVFIGTGVFLLAWRPQRRTQAARGIAVSLLAILFTSHLVYRQVGWDYYNMTPISQRLSEIERQGARIAHLGKYNGDFHFLGHLHHPFIVIHEERDLVPWLEEHPDDYVLIIYRHKDEKFEDGAEYGQYYRGSRRISVWKASELLSRPNTLARLLES